MMVVGLTGGIGSGKTSVLQLFINKGIAVYIADSEAKELMQNDKNLIKDIITIFGKESYSNKKLNRAYLAKQVFSNSEKLKKLNAIVHPAVHTHFMAFKSRQTGPFLIYENAILFENGSDKLCDYIITVTAPVATRIKRVMQRDGVSSEQVKDRIKHQWDDKLKIEKSDFTIINSDWETTKETVNRLYEKLLRISKTEKS